MQSSRWSFWRWARSLVRTALLCGNLSKVLDKSPVIGRLSLETSDISHFQWYWPLLDCFDLFWVSADTFGRDHMTKGRYSRS